MSEDNIKFLAVARASDKAILCSYTPLLKNASLRTDSVIYTDMTNKVLKAPTWREQVDPDTSHSLDCTPNKFHFKMDKNERVFIVITSASYPSRLAFQCLDKLRVEFVDKCDAKSLTCTAGGLTKDCSKIMQKIGLEFDDPSKHDKVAHVALQVDQVKVVMQDNIQNVLQNTERMESVEEKTIQLNEQAKVFRNTGRSLQRKLWWKNLKTNAIIGLCIVLVIVILLALVGAFDSADETTSN